MLATGVREALTICRALRSFLISHEHVWVGFAEVERGERGRQPAQEASCNRLWRREKSEEGEETASEEGRSESYKCGGPRVIV